MERKRWSWEMDSYHLKGHVESTKNNEIIRDLWLNTIFCGVYFPVQLFYPPCACAFWYSLWLHWSHIIFCASKLLPYFSGCCSVNEAAVQNFFNPSHSVCVVLCFIYFTQSKIGPGYWFVHQIVCAYAMKGWIIKHKGVELRLHVVEFRLGISYPDFPT